MKVLGVGESVLDNYMKKLPGSEVLEAIPMPARQEERVGGPIAAALILLARLGVECEFITGIGPDAAGRVITQALQNEGITLRHHPQTESKIGTIIVDAVSGQRTKVHATARHTPLQNIEASYLAQFDLILIDRHEREAFYEIMRKKQPTTKVVIDPSTEISDFTYDMLRHAEYPIIPIESLGALHPEHDLLSAAMALYQHCRRPFVVTLSELGSLLYDGQRLEFVPAIEVQAVDTCGAGDIFRGAFAYGVLKKWHPRRCLRFANVAAGLQCTKLGNVAAIPTKAEIEAQMRATRRQLDFSHVHSEYLKHRQFPGVTPSTRAYTNVT